ncbi:DUF2939 domain-containing protein [Roseomonas frigidaquae]|uniref:DUF2939 domain-containing protein n=1 Tax=Falsiroseomonas frigidaquae TaxID=487318 RepID=A0ABX1ET67_9PROT|nr:DUF2939 domain-containing protein [Falsiroseomonas frigidaquae]
MDTRSVGAAEHWDEVWAEYDARQPAPPAPLPPRRPVRPPEIIAPPPAVQATSLSRESRSRSPWAALALLPLLGLGWMGAPYATAWNLAQALEARDGAEMSRHLDLPAMQAAVRESLLPHTASGDRTPEARAFLSGMAEDIAAAWANPTALAEVARARGVPAGAAVQALRGTVPTGLTRFEMALEGSVAPIRLQIELTGAAPAPRWQVTGVRLENRQPIPAPSPMRVSALR